MTTQCRVVLITASNAKEADKISREIIRGKLAVCVNCIPKIHSRYWWKGKIEESSETLLIVKTKQTLIKKLIAKIKAVHSYSVPEVIALPIMDGNPDYLRWIKESI